MAGNALALILPFFIMVTSNVSGESAEAHLIKDLMMNYSNELRPVFNYTDIVHVNINVTLSGVLGLDEKKEVITWVIWIEQGWEDKFLRWSPASYNGIRLISLGAEKIWMPDFYVHNIVGESQNLATMFLGTNGDSVTLDHTGQATRYSRFQAETPCNVDMTWFPFDTQVCSLEGGSWGFPEDLLVYQEGAPPVISADNGSWRFISFLHKKGLRRRYKGFDYHRVMFTLTMKRNPLFYILNLIVPSYFMSAIMMLSLFLPVECGERMSVGLTVFMTYSVFTLIISNIVPDSAESPPILSILFLINMSLSLVVNTWTVLVIRIHNTWTDGPPPSWLIKLLRPTKKPLNDTTADSNQFNTETGDGDRRGNENIAGKDNTEATDNKVNEGKISTSSSRKVKEESLEEWKYITNFGDKVFLVGYLIMLFSGPILMLMIP